MKNLIDDYLSYEDLQDYEKTYKFLCDAINSDSSKQLAGFELVGLMLDNTYFFGVPPLDYAKLKTIKRVYDKKLFDYPKSL